METIFGPVPSRRLGRSIGINNVPPKHCTYSCLYCQLGRAVKVTVDRKEFYNPEELMGADWISIKVDAVTESVWRKIDRPHRAINHEAMLEGALTFAHAFSRNPGTVLTTESMLVEGINTAEEDLKAAAEYVGRLDPDIVYISIPTRPLQKPGFRQHLSLQ